jgi:hypothetical protein
MNDHLTTSAQIAFARLADNLIEPTPQELAIISAYGKEQDDD